MNADADVSADNSAPRLNMQPLLVRAPQAATLCGVSPRHWRKMNSAGCCPESIDLAGVEVWSVAMLTNWIERGCPNREDVAMRSHRDLVAMQ